MGCGFRWVVGLDGFRWVFTYPLTLPPTPTPTPTFTPRPTLEAVLELTRAMGKVGVVVGNCDGFVGNRVLDPYSYEASFMLEEGEYCIVGGR